MSKRIHIQRWGTRPAAQESIGWLHGSDLPRVKRNKLTPLARWRLKKAFEKAEKIGVVGLPSKPLEPDA